MAAGGCPVEQYNTAEPEATRAPCPRGRPAPVGHNQRWRGTPWSRCAHAPPDRPLTGPRTQPPAVGGAGGEKLFVYLGKNALNFGLALRANGSE